jgi:hypothetical protein
VLPVSQKVPRAQVVVVRDPGAFLAKKAAATAAAWLQQEDKAAGERAARPADPLRACR